jgi:aryl-alcohol dehydrogenase-like predicted oxidoreductase
MRDLGDTGIRVSSIGLGTVKLGRAVGVKYPAPFSIPDDEAATHLLRRARELGVNLLDTAPAYGNSESRLGTLLQGWRDEWVIVSKAGETFDGEVSHFDFSPEGITSSVERSLARLKTSCLDVVLLHSGGEAELHFDETGSFEALAHLKAQGKIRAFGASTKTLRGAQLAIDRCDVVMLTLNPQERNDEPAIESASKKSVGVLIKKALQSGHAVQESGGAMDPVERSLRFVFAHAGVSSVVVGTIDPDHLAHDVAAAHRALVPGEDSQTQEKGGA